MPQVLSQLNTIRLNKSRRRDVSLVREPVTGYEFVIKRYPIKSEAVREHKALRLCQDDHHFPRLLDFYKQGDNWCIVMEFIKGDDLDSTLEHVGPLRVEDTIDLTVDILKGVQVLHQRGYVHGDLRGKNVMIEDLTRAKTKIIDLQHAVKKRSTGQATAIRSPKKTHLMLAPETQVGVIDDRYDLYSVGYMCACMLAGKKLDHRLKARDLSGGALLLLTVVCKAMRKNPRKRYRSAQTMINDLWRIRKQCTGHESQKI